MGGFACPSRLEAQLSLSVPPQSVRATYVCVFTFETQGGFSPFV